MPIDYISIAPTGTLSILAFRPSHAHFRQISLDKLSLRVITRSLRRLNDQEPSGTLVALRPLAVPRLFRVVIKDIRPGHERS